MVLVMLEQDYSGQERMDSMKSWAGIEKGKAGRSVCCVMQSVRVLVMCCGIVLHMLVLGIHRVRRHMPRAVNNIV